MNGHGKWRAFLWNVQSNYHVIVPPAQVDGGWRPQATQELLIRPTLDSDDYGDNSDLTYQIDGVTFTATKLTEPVYDVGQWNAAVGSSTKQNPANVVVRDAYSLTLIAGDGQIRLVGTLVASYYIFRPLIAGAATEATGAAMVLATNGKASTEAIHAAHEWLKYGVGGAFIVGFAVAIAIYGRGLATATAIKKVLAPIHLVLEKKYFFDELYDFVWVKGCVLVAHIARFIDTYIVDMVFNLAAAITERFAAFCGLILDNHGVDGVVNGIAASSRDVGDLMRRPQTGRIRNYVLLATGAATIVIVCFLIWWSEPHKEMLASVISARP
ncbi:MAG: hypothetical protein IH897_13915 [Planctomycetes bacterium]|nr:hypothetical protein [Planctomycetota bacterium]